MTENYIYKWRSFDSLPLFSAMIQVTFEETEQQYQLIKKLQINTSQNQVTINLVNKLIKYYRDQLDEIMYYQEQLDRWLEIAVHHKYGEKLTIIVDLTDKVKKMYELTLSIIHLASLLALADVDKHNFFSEDKEVNVDF